MESSSQMKYKNFVMEINVFANILIGNIGCFFFSCNGFRMSLSNF